MNQTFRLKAYGKSELAMLYFPEASSTHVAVNHFMSWIKRNRTLMLQLHDAGYRKASKTLTPKEVALIVDYLGEP